MNEQPQEMLKEYYTYVNKSLHLTNGKVSLTGGTSGTNDSTQGNVENPVTTLVDNPKQPKPSEGRDHGKHDEGLHVPGTPGD